MINVLLHSAKQFKSNIIPQMQVPVLKFIVIGMGITTFVVVT